MTTTDWLYALCYIVAQFLGAMLGAALVWGCMNAQILKLATGGDGTEGTIYSYCLQSVTLNNGAL